MWKIDVAIFLPAGHDKVLRLRVVGIEKIARAETLAGQTPSGGAESLRGSPVGGCDHIFARRQVVDPVLASPVHVGKKARAEDAPQRHCARRPRQSQDSGARHRLAPRVRDPSTDRAAPNQAKGAERTGRVIAAEPHIDGGVQVVGFGDCDPVFARGQVRNTKPPLGIGLQVGGRGGAREIARRALLHGPRAFPNGPPGRCLRVRRHRRGSQIGRERCLFHTPGSCPPAPWTISLTAYIHAANSKIKAITRCTANYQRTERPIGPGTAHALGGGLVLCEIQQNHPATYPTGTAITC
jgi:hypothetical protein